MRRAGKVDVNQGEIVSALRSAGARVYIASHVGGGFPDLVVTYQSRLHLLEIKRPHPPSAKRLTTAELEFARQHPVAVVCTPKEALTAVGFLVGE